MRLEMKSSFKTRCPLRISFAGGGTELSPYVDEFGGNVLNATISMYAYSSVAPRCDGMVVLKSLDNSVTEMFSISELLKKGFTNDWLKIHLACLQFFYSQKPQALEHGIEIATVSDSPVGSGLGTSSTIAISLIKSLAAYLGFNLSNHEVSKLGHYLERDVLGLAGGLQDQYSAAFGGVNFMEFKTDGSRVITPLNLSAHVGAELEASMLLFYTGQSRSSASIISEQVTNMKSGNVRIDYYHKVKAHAHQAKEALLDANIPQLGSILDESWKLKKSLSPKISNEDIDTVYSELKRMGIYGGKITGAGGGGFMLILVNIHLRSAVMRYLNSTELPGSFIATPSLTSPESSYTWTV